MNAAEAVDAPEREGEIAGLRDIAELFDVAILDQWGVLHDGIAPYPHAVAALEGLAAAGKRVAVLSNSGKRSDLNMARIAACGLPTDTIEVVMTSGEALWRDVRDGHLAMARPFAITGAPGDAERWADGLDVTPMPSPDGADALLVMGLPDGAALHDYEATLAAALAAGLPLVCSNPDRLSPRADGPPLLQPGALAADYEARGGRVVWYGKPHAPIFEAVRRVFPDVAPSRIAMVGDSPEHDVAGGQRAGWRTVLVRGGLHAAELEADDATVAALCARHAAPPPDHHSAWLAW